MNAKTIIPTEILHESFEDETVVVNMSRGHYFSFRGKSIEVWNALAVGMGEADVLMLFGGDQRTSMERILGLLAQEGLIGRETAPADKWSPEEWLAGTVFEDEVERFTDVEGLLLLDPIHDVDDAGWPTSVA